MQVRQLSLLVLAAALSGPLSSVQAQLYPPGVYGPSYSGRGIVFRSPRPDDELFPIEVQGWWGHVARDRRLVVFPQYHWADYSYEGFIRVVMDGKTGFVNGTGRWLVPARLDYADRFEEGMAVVGMRDRDSKMRYGFINKARKLAVPYQLDAARRFKDGIAVVQVDGLCGYIRKDGKFAIRPQYVRARSFHEGVAAVQLRERDGSGGDFAFINRTGRILFRSDEIEALGDMNDGYAMVRVADKWGFLSKDYKLAIPPQFEEVRDFTGGVAAARIEDKWGFIDKTGKFTAPPVFDKADDMDDTFALIAQGKFVGFINRNASQGYEPQFDWALPFYRRWARASVGDTFGYINTAGQVQYDPRALLEGIYDVTNRAKGVDASFPDTAGVPIRLPPPRRVDHRKPPYPPEYEYDEGLPLPIRE